MQIAGLVMLLALASGVYADKSNGFFNENFGNFQDELDTAKEQGKKGIFMFFMMDECPFCDRTEKTILSLPEVQKYFHEHFMNFIMDIEGDVQITDFKGEETTQKKFSTKQFRVRATPLMVFFDLEGKPIVRYTGAPKDKDEFLLLGQYVVSGAYQNMKFPKYKREARLNAE